MNDLDRILDEAVESYAAVKPSQDFEQRVLARVRQLEKPHSARWPWAAGLAVVLAALLAVVVVQKMRLPEPPSAIAVSPPQPTAVLIRTVLPVVSSSGSRSGIKTRGAMTRPVMLSYSPAELAALTFVKEHPEEAAQVAKLEERDDAMDRNPLREAQIEIAPIQIQPITIPLVHEENKP